MGVIFTQFRTHNDKTGADGNADSSFTVAQIMWTRMFKPQIIHLIIVEEKQDKLGCQNTGFWFCDGSNIWRNHWRRSHDFSFVYFLYNDHSRRK